MAREAAVSDLRQAAKAARDAGGLQMQAELILAYGLSLSPGASVLETADYDGEPVKIKLDPEIGYVENAQRLFDKAKKAKAGGALVQDQLQRLSADKAALESVLARLLDAGTLRDIEAIRDEAKKHRWLHEQHTGTGAKQVSPWAGHKIRELRGPRDFRVLYGENATSNDYLTTRVAKPNDLWLHVRGGTSAHVIVATDNHPERVGKDVLEFAAKVAVQNSTSKHSSLVAVDYTLKKHVRKPRGSAAGFAVYTQEKTLHVGR
jgi:predicted ribosome quality control (RQC) complex YloA/Tae2 family protein